MPPKNGENCVSCKLWPLLHKTSHYWEHFGKINRDEFNAMWFFIKSTIVNFVKMPQTTELSRLYQIYRYMDLVNMVDSFFSANCVVLKYTCITRMIIKIVLLIVHVPWFYSKNKFHLDQTLKDLICWRCTVVPVIWFS